MKNNPEHLKELEFHGREFALLVEKIKKRKPGTKRYSNLFAELWMESEVLRSYLTIIRFEDSGSFCARIDDEDEH